MDIKHFDLIVPGILNLLVPISLISVWIFHEIYIYYFLAVGFITLFILWSIGIGRCYFSKSSVKIDRESDHLALFPEEDDDDDNQDYFAPPIPIDNHQPISTRSLGDNNTTSRIETEMIPQGQNHQLDSYSLPFSNTGQLPNSSSTSTTPEAQFIYDLNPPLLHDHINVALMTISLASLFGHASIGFFVTYLATFAADFLYFLIPFIISGSITLTLSLGETFNNCFFALGSFFLATCFGILHPLFDGDNSLYFIPISIFYASFCSFLSITPPLIISPYHHNSSHEKHTFLYRRDLILSACFLAILSVIGMNSILIHIPKQKSGLFFVLFIFCTLLTIALLFITLRIQSDIDWKTTTASRSTTNRMKTGVYSWKRWFSNQNAPLSGFFTPLNETSLGDVEILRHETLSEEPDRRDSRISSNALPLTPSPYHNQTTLYSQPSGDGNSSSSISRKPLPLDNRRPLTQAQRLARGISPSSKSQISKKSSSGRKKRQIHMMERTWVSSIKLEPTSDDKDDTTTDE